MSRVKIQILLLDMFKILDNIYDRSIAIVFGTVFFSSFWRLWKLIFFTKKIQNLIFLFYFYPNNSRTGSTKTSITQELLVIESCPTFFLIFCRLVYDISSHLNDHILAWSTSLQVSHQSSKVSYQKVRTFSNFWNKQ